MPPERCGQAVLRRRVRAGGRVSQRVRAGVLRGLLAAARRPAPVSGCTSGAARRLSCTPGVPGDRGRPLRSTAPEGGVGGGKRRWGTGGGRRGLLPLRAFLSPSSPPLPAAQARGLRSWRLGPVAARVSGVLSLVGLARPLAREEGVCGEARRPGSAWSPSSSRLPPRGFSPGVPIDVVTSRSPGPGLSRARRGTDIPGEWGRSSRSARGPLSSPARLKAACGEGRGAESGPTSRAPPPASRRWRGRGLLDAAEHTPPGPRARASRTALPPRGGEGAVQPPRPCALPGPSVGAPGALQVVSQVPEAEPVVSFPAPGDPSVEVTPAGSCAAASVGGGPSRSGGGGHPFHARWGVGCPVGPARACRPSRGWARWRASEGRARLSGARIPLFRGRPRRSLSPPGPRARREAPVRRARGASLEGSTGPPVSWAAMARVGRLTFTCAAGPSLGRRRTDAWLVCPAGARARVGAGDAPLGEKAFSSDPRGCLWGTAAPSRRPSSVRVVGHWVPLLRPVWLGGAPERQMLFPAYRVPRLPPTRRGRVTRGPRPGCPGAPAGARRAARWRRAGRRERVRAPPLTASRCFSPPRAGSPLLAPVPSRGRWAPRAGTGRAASLGVGEGGRAFALGERGFPERGPDDGEELGGALSRRGSRVWGPGGGAGPRRGSRCAWLAAGAGRRPGRRGAALVCGGGIPAGFPGGPSVSLAPGPEKQPLPRARARLSRAPALRAVPSSPLWPPSLPVPGPPLASAPGGSRDRPLAARGAPSPLPSSPGARGSAPRGAGRPRSPLPGGAGGERVGAGGRDRRCRTGERGPAAAASAAGPSRPREGPCLPGKRDEVGWRPGQPRDRPRAPEKGAPRR